jgi:hypothetical protein
MMVKIFTSACRHFWLDLRSTIKWLTKAICILGPSMFIWISTLKWALNSTNPIYVTAPALLGALCAALLWVYISAIWFEMKK